MSLEYILNGAIFIADAHENGSNRKDLALFLQKIKQGDINAPQLFLMGDMFDLLVGGVKYSLCCEYTQLLDKIADKISVYYLEGNHDFNIKSLFKKVKVIPLKQQPFFLCAQNNNIKFALSHGDLYVGRLYGLYAKIIRSKTLIFTLNVIDIKGWLSRLILKSQKNKNICRKIENFKLKIERKIKSYPPCDFIAEGHYHQNRFFDFGDKKYINFASFACEKVFYVFDGFEFKQNAFNG